MSCNSIIIFFCSMEDVKAFHYTFYIFNIYFQYDRFISCFTNLSQQNLSTMYLRISLAQVFNSQCFWVVLWPLFGFPFQTFHPFASLHITILNYFSVNFVESYCFLYSGFFYFSSLFVIVNASPSSLNVFTCIMYLSG